MPELLKIILIAVGAPVIIWILLIISWLFAIAITEPYSQSVMDDYLEKMHRKLLKFLGTETDHDYLDDVEKKRQQAIENAKNFSQNEKPEKREICFASCFGCKGVIRTLEELKAIKDPQEGDKYLVFNQDETVDDYIRNLRKIGVRFRYWDGDWYIDLIHIDISDRDEASVYIKYFVTETQRLVPW